MARIHYQAAIFILAVALLIFSTTAIRIWHPEYFWHNQQRVAQLGLLITALLFFSFLAQSFIPKMALAVLLIIFILGLFSTYLAQWPEWALKEWARYVGLVALAVMVASLAYANKRAYAFVFGLMVAVGSLLAVFFMILYGLKMTSDTRLIDANRLFTGFSQLRAFGQFQVVLFPVLTLVFSDFYRRQKNLFAFLVFSVFALHWCIAFSLAGRGLWLGLSAAAIGIVLAHRPAIQLVRIQLFAAVIGLLLYGVLFHLVPFVLDIEVKLYDNLRTSLSGRHLLWGWAWDMALANPWLGAGPMHFATVYSNLGAHPHQVVLQWLAEWGFVVTGLAIVLAGWGVLHGLGCVRAQKKGFELDACLWMAIVGALVLAQVDGVLVMPYIETWLAILIGLSLARWSKAKSVGLGTRSLMLALTLPAMLVLLKVVLTEVPQVPQLEKPYANDPRPGWNPRFWQKGWIPMRQEVQPKLND